MMPSLHYTYKNISMWRLSRLLPRSISVQVPNTQVQKIRTKTTNLCESIITNKKDLHESTKNQTYVALNMTKHLILSSKKGHNKNLVFSPLSIHVVLSIIAAGSAARARDRMLSFLRFKSMDHLNSYSSQLAAIVLKDGSPAGGHRLQFACGAWIDQSLPLKPSFKHILHAHYNAALASLDFQNKADEARNEVNSWTKKETNDLIKEILPPDSVDRLTRLIFANTLYFKGAWDQKFDASKTKDYDFHLLNGTSIKVPFMTSQEKQFIEVFNGFKILGLPYKRGKDKRQFSMYIFLPDAKDGLSALVDKVCSKSGFLECELPYNKVKVGDFRIPRFKFSFGFEAPEVLHELGLVLPSCGDLTEMVDSSDSSTLSISNIFHKTLIEVNEEGTEAVTATATYVAKSMRSKIDFVADHPFLFVIREDVTGSILFIGQVINPHAE